jgi:hypothetical protein
MPFFRGQQALIFSILSDASSLPQFHDEVGACPFVFFLWRQKLCIVSLIKKFMEQVTVFYMSWEKIPIPFYTNLLSRQKFTQVFCILGHPISCFFLDLRGKERSVPKKTSQFFLLKSPK